MITRIMPRVIAGCSGEHLLCTLNRACGDVLEDKPINHEVVPVLLLEERVRLCIDVLALRIVRPGCQLEFAGRGIRKERLSTLFCVCCTPCSPLAEGTVEGAFDVHSPQSCIECRNTLPSIGHNMRRLERSCLCWSHISRQLQEQLGRQQLREGILAVAVAVVVLREHVAK